ncbi:MAG: glycine cleavage system aminomethyltransferase GcvT [PVC group bacterium]|nr:glycine cleavage system aminomethyltransferase GcvT [PVC group bacterium]
MELKQTILVEEHKTLGAKLAPFGGWFMPIQYSGIIAEHKWTRNSCSVFDICHMGEFIVRGELQASCLDKLVTSDLAGMSCGSCRYGFMLDQAGGIIDDVIVYKIKEDEWMLVVNAATIDRDFTHIKNHISSQVNIENVSDTLGKLDLQGPDSCEVLKKIIGDDIAKLKYYKFGYFPMMGEQILISRTGYTGERGYELYISNEKIVDLWKLLLEDDRVKPAGLGARDTLRLEMCYPLYGQDIDKQSSPFEAGLDKFVDLSKEFIGKEEVLKKKEDSIGKKLSCFMTQARRAPRHNYKIYNKDKEIGVVTSGSFSPSLSCGIGMGYIELGYNKAGTEIVLKEGNIEIEAKVVEKPFYKEGTARR